MGVIRRMNRALCPLAVARRRLVTACRCDIPECVAEALAMSLPRSNEREEVARTQQ